MLIRLLLIAGLFFTLLTLVGWQNSDQLAEFVGLLPGNYSTEAMWKKDSTLAHVQLHIVPIWKDDKDGHWFYLEQAEVKSLQRPYRQAVLHITANHQQIVSTNLTIQNRLSFAGAWKDAALLTKLSKSNLDFSNPCVIYFTRVKANHFKGGTGGGGCSNQYKGASYFTNQSELTEKGLSSWDRGWNADGQLAWGPATHGYTFDKLKY
ncbi:MAG: chromophore lyase CpcT/CpeT [Cytophagales bacterium]